MSNFTSVADALNELVDNAIDHRWGQPLTIELVQEKRSGCFVIESDGGRGMGAGDILDWLNWGAGQEHDPSHIGKYHQGGKAACGFLGKHIKLWAKRAESDDVWFLEDEDWSTREEPKNFGTPSPLLRTSYPRSMQALHRDCGHVRIEINGLDKDRRWNLEDLKRSISSTYRSLLEGAVQIKVNGDPVPPLVVPISTAIESLKVHAKFSRGRSVTGWAGRMMRDQTNAPVKSGLRLIHNGRLIKDGEWFGYNHEGKGALATLFGELHLKGFQPIPNKTDFVERSDQVWTKLTQAVLKELAPLIAQLRSQGDQVRVSKREKDTVAEVADELQDVYQALEESVEDGVATDRNGFSGGVGMAGRKRPEPGDNPSKPTQNPLDPNHDSHQPKTPPPQDPVGTLARLLKNVTGGSTRPPLRIRAWDSSERSTWNAEGSRTWLDINKSFPLYQSLKGVKPYLAETAILELCKPKQGETMDASRYVEHVDLMLSKWMRLGNQETDD